jgi:hypothetical protein
MHFMKRTHKMNAKYVRNIGGNLYQFALGPLHITQNISSRLRQRQLSVYRKCQNKRWNCFVLDVLSSYAHLLLSCTLFHKIQQITVKAGLNFYALNYFKVLHAIYFMCDSNCLRCRCISSSAL